METEIRQFVIGPIETNSYLAIRAGQALIIDPSSGCDEMLAVFRDEGVRPLAILLTHAHFDHIMGIGELLERYPELPVWVHADDVAFLSDAELNGSTMVGRRFTFRGAVQQLQEGRQSIGPFEFDVLHVPGHTPGGCALVFDDVCLTGDVLFAGSIGRSDLQGGDGDQLVASIQGKLMKLPGNTRVLPGHGPDTTIERERWGNPYLQ